MKFQYPAIYTRQRDEQGPLFATFVAPAGEIAQWAEISRIKHDGSGHQRLRSESRVQAISRYLEQDNQNSIPTALVVALRIPDFEEPDLSQCSSIDIAVDGDERPGLLIDGQHRMFGAAAFEPNTPLHVVALINASDEEIAFQFLVINGKSSKVPTDHVKFLALQFTDDALADRLTTARMALGRGYKFAGIVDNASDSPFYQSVIWPTEARPADASRTELVRPAAIEQAIAAIAQKNLPDLANDDALLEFFFTLWRSVKQTWPKLWHADSKLLMKVGVVTLTMFVIDDLVPLADRDDIDLSDPAAVREEVDENILSYLCPEFWERAWSSKSLDTSAGRQLVVDDLTTMRRNMVRGTRWDSDVRLVSSEDEELA